MKNQLQLRTLKYGSIVLLSLLTSALLLLLERAIGIGWDFHPDSVTYFTTSQEMYEAILENGMSIFNNGYYIVSYLLGQSICTIISMNMLLYALSNILIIKLVRERSEKYVSIYMLLLLLLNPYRVHLSTTMLKESLIIFLLLVAINAGVIIRGFSIINLIIIRIVSPLYLLIFIPRKYIILMVIFCLSFLMIYSEMVFGRILEFNDQEMQLREFDKIPTFQQWGIWGALVRGLIWSLLSFTGIFALISPAPAFIPVAMGSLMTIVFIMKLTGELKIPVQILISLIVFGVMVTGFTAYIRYIYPLLVVWPIIALEKNG